MNVKKDADEALSTDPYKGVRDFYPDDMALQRYIFDTWSRTAESFGFERYDASVLEPSGLYQAKSSEEIVSEQTYTFTDRGERSVTLRPEMTPTVARMVAGKRRELTFPLRWYSIPNLFRYERPQRGRLREHWQLNCDIFGIDHYAADVEIISLAHQMLIDFGATSETFEIKMNHRKLLTEGIEALAGEVGVKLHDQEVQKVIRVIDKKNKLDRDAFNKELTEAVGKDVSEVILEKYGSEDLKAKVMKSEAYETLMKVRDGLRSLGISTTLDTELARGFDYYTGIIFEIFDVSGENTRSLLGGGRYDNLTELFGGKPISGVGFGMGDVTMRDFLETHNLTTANLTSPTVMVIPTDVALNIEGEKIAQELRVNEINVAVDLGTKKLGKKIAAASAAFVEYALVVGEDEVKNESYTLKMLESGEEKNGSLEDLIKIIKE